VFPFSVDNQLLFSLKKVFFFFFFYKVAVDQSTAVAIFSRSSISFMERRTNHHRAHLPSGVYTGKGFTAADTSLFSSSSV
jgi:hypothetical protein